MNIWTFSLCRNEADIIPFFLRHYGSFVDQINVWDDGSTDGSRELLSAHPKVKLHEWPGGNGIDEDAFLAFAYATYPQACGFADWAMWVDMDEFIYHPRIREILEIERGQFDVLPTEGFNMMNRGLPEDDGRQIWECVRTGVPAPVYGKPVVFNPCRTIRWNRGKHDLEGEFKVHPERLLKLLHYRYLGFDYTLAKNQRNFDRVDLIGGDKGPAWSCSPEWKGQHSPEWAESALKLAKPVI